MKKLLMVAMLLASCAALSDTEVVDGIEWIYQLSPSPVSDGKNMIYYSHFQLG